MDEMTAIRYTQDGTPDAETALEALLALGARPSVVEAIGTARTRRRRYYCIKRIEHYEFDGLFYDLAVQLGIHYGLPLFTVNPGDLDEA